MQSFPKPFTRLMFCAGLSALTAFSLLPDAEAAKLSDLIKRPPEVFLPTQVIPGKTARFTVRGKAGKEVRLILSALPVGKAMPNGVTPRAGEPTAEAKGTIPATGILELSVDIPNDEALLGDRQFVEAVVWSSPDQSDAELAQMIENTGNPTTENVLAVGMEPDPGGTMLIPGGDPTVTNLMRSFSAMNDIGNDPRKKQLVDDGAINRERLLDKNLTNTGSSPK